MAEVWTLKNVGVGVYLCFLSKDTENEENESHTRQTTSSIPEKHENR